MSELALSPISVQDLNVFANNRDILQDLFTYLEYVREHQIKRMFRTNQLPKSDSLRIAKAMGDRDIEQAVKETGGAAWIDFIDNLAFRMGLVSYDTEGKYQGYSSTEPSFVDNYVTVVEKAYQNFLELEPARQEKRMLKALVAENRRRDYDISN